MVPGLKLPPLNLNLASSADARAATSAPFDASGMVVSYGASRWETIAFAGVALLVVLYLIRKR